MHGVTFADSLLDAAAPERHTQQYFETIGNRAMYKDGWWLAMKTPRIPWVLTPEALRALRPRRVGPRRRPGRAVLPARRLQPGQRPGRRAPEKVAGAQGPVLAGGREVQGAAAAGDALGVLRHHCRRSGGHRQDSSSAATCRTSPPGMIPRIYNHSYTISADLVVPPRGRRGRHRGRGRPPRAGSRCSSTTAGSRTPTR